MSEEGYDFMKTYLKYFYILLNERSNIQLIKYLCLILVFVFLQEYSLIMSERDSVHKEIEKFQEEIKEKNKKLAAQDGRHKHHEDEVNRVSLNQDLNFKLGI